MIKKKISAVEVVNFLNDLLKIDPTPMNALFNLRVFCSKEFANHKTVQVGEVYKGAVYSVGFIGILNGLFGTDRNGWGILSMELKNGKIKKFELLKPNTKGKEKEIK